MTTPDISGELRFDIDASILFQLGEDLISDDVQALVELVKNAYDADASYVRLVVDTKNGSREGSAYPDAKGYILVEDDGVGMNLSTIKRGWLTLSSSPKRELKSKGMTTDRGRTPLGDKGLGRLGAQRLGHNMEIFTRPQGGDTEYHVPFSWKDYAGGVTLGDVPIPYTEIEPRRQTGTSLIISDLKDAAAWTGSAVSRLETDLSRMISPYQEARDFTIVATVDGKRLDFAEITEQVRQAAEVRYKVNFDGKVFRIEGKARLAFFRPENKEDRHLFRELVEVDGGERFLRFLQKSPGARTMNLTRSKNEGWFVDYERVRAFDKLDSLEMLDGKLANPGPFRAEVDSFDLGREGAGEQSAFDSVSEFRKYVGELSGVRVYRDGFGIRVDQDWLRLGEQQTSATSYYGLRPKNILGYVALSAKENSMLEETTDREGFKATPYYANFRSLIDEFTRFTLEAQSLLRRRWIQFRNEHREEIADTTQTDSPRDLARRINRSLAEAEKQRQPLIALRGTLETTAQRAQHALESTESTLFGDDAQAREARHTANLLKENIEVANQAISQVERYLEDISELLTVGEVLNNRIELLEDQLAQVYETVSLGLTAEALSHEIRNVADQLAERNQQARQRLRSSNINDATLISYTEYVNSSISALRKQLSHLAPSLRYVREKRELLSLKRFFDETLEYYQARFQNRSIKVEIKDNNSHEFMLSMNRGKLTQIVDNLFLNSEYWLREDLRRGHIREGLITIELAKPFVRISDNGKGVDPSVEDTLFEAFVTTKGRGKGRGLGLFIIRQLLDSEGCSISLLPKRNQYGSLNVFEIDFSGALSGNAG